MSNSGVKRGLGLGNPFPNLKSVGNGGVLTKSNTAEGGLTFQSPIPGLQMLTGGGTITTNTILLAIASGYVGLYLDPRFIWNMQMLSFSNVGFGGGVQNFTIESRMGGSIGYNSSGLTFGANVQAPPGYINTTTTQISAAGSPISTTFNIAATSGGGFSAVQVGMQVHGTGVPAGTYVTAVLSGGNTINISQAATSSPGSETLTFSSDGLQIFTTSTTQYIQGIVLRGLAFVGSNPGAACVHFGGGQRNCRMEDCFVYNTSNATSPGSYGLADDTGLGQVNGENQKYESLYVAGAYGAIGIGVSSPVGAANDTLWIDVTTAAGTFGINAGSGTYPSGSQHQFYNYYDRSNPVTATVNNQGATLQFFGGEDRNVVGYAHQVITGTTSIINRIISGGSGVINISGTGSQTPRFSFQGDGQIQASSSINITGNLSVLDMSQAPSYLWNSVAIDGASGQVYLPPRWGLGGNASTYPNLSGFSGTVLGDVPFSTSQGSTTGTHVPSWTPPSTTQIPNLLGLIVRVNLYIHATAVTTSIVPNVGWTDEGGAIISPTSSTLQIPMQKMNSGSGPVVSITTTGYYTGSVILNLNNAGGVVETRIVPTSATYTYSVHYEILDYIL